MDKGYEVRKSNIHGKGLFTTRSRKRNDVIGVVVERRNGVLDVTQDIGIWVNHSELRPNVGMTRCRDEWCLYALRDIFAGEELVANYYDAPPFIKRPEDYGGGFKP